MLFAAFDLHKKFIQATTFDNLGHPVHSERFPAIRQAIQAIAAGHLTPRHQVAIEATFNTWEIVAIPRPLAGEVAVSNPQRTRALAQAKLLLSTPGVDVAVTESHYFTLGDTARFRKPDAAASYSGLVPSTYQSGETCYHGRITKGDATESG